MRSLEELTVTDDPAWPIIQDLVAESGVPARILPVDAGEGRRSLLQMQVTVRSVLGALALHCGGLILDDGWLRVYGGGSDGGESGGEAEGAGMPSLAQVNGFPEAFDPTWQPSAALVVGHDALGGVFALNSHDPAAAGRPGVPGQMTYFAPDSLEWEAMEMGHSAWVEWLLSGRLDQFYEGLRWPGWRAEAAALMPAQGITVFPPLWSAEGRGNLAGTSRRAVPMGELLGLAADFLRQMGPGDPGFLGQV